MIIDFFDELFVLLTGETFGNFILPLTANLLRVRFQGIMTLIFMCSFSWFLLRILHKLKIVLFGNKRKKGGK